MEEKRLRRKLADIEALLEALEKQKDQSSRREAARQRQLAKGIEAELRHLSGEVLGKNR